MNKTCDTCGGSQKVVVGCAFDSPITVPCPACSKMPRRWCSVHNREEFKYESLEHELHAPPSTSAAIRAAAEEIANIYGLHHSLTGVVAILSRYFGKGEAEKSQPGEEGFKDLGMTTCGACQSRHPIPRNAAQQVEMGCKGRWYFADAAAKQ